RQSVPDLLFGKGDGAELVDIGFACFDRRNHAPHNHHPRFLLIGAEEQAASAGLLIGVLDDDGEQSGAFALEYQWSTHRHERPPPGSRISAATCSCSASPSPTEILLSIFGRD